jgi:hypothetical protein
LTVFAAVVTVPAVPLALVVVVVLPPEPVVLVPPPEPVVVVVPPLEPLPVFEVEGGALTLLPPQAARRHATARAVSGTRSDDSVARAAS